VLTVLTADATWVLPPTRALWIPAGLPHETASDGGRATMRSLYIRPGLFRVSWDETGRPTPVAASPLLAELIGYLGEPGLDAARRAHAETLLADLLAPVPVTTIQVGLPETATARRVAEAGMPFGRWRTLLRLQTALSMLAADVPVSRVAGRVGYDTPSAFVAAFRRETGQTPGALFRD
jgi:hypothetical protein